MKLKISNFFNKQNFAVTLFLAPAVIGTFIFIVIPTIASFGLSFMQWDLLNDIKFVGFSNLITEKKFKRRKKMKV